jgi:hypothetical protein
VECVSDRIRYEGNLGLGICAVPNGCDADSGKALGKCSHGYLRNALIIYEENTKEIMSVKEFVYLIQNHADLHKL